ncbi:MAG: ribonuclease P protein component [Armatimonadota bacterium]
MLPSQARLTSSRSFKTVYGRGRSGATDLIVVYVLPRSGKQQIRFGFTAGKKVGGAVQRNRAKRLMREAAKSLIERISGSYDIIVIARRGTAAASLSCIRADMEKLLKRLMSFG